MSTQTKTTIREGYEPIPGYRLEHQLGSGGFGEVWRCSAPGGLHKAIKFVFGSLDDKRAKRELKSLERIKGVHHPFLLTLERFEVVDGRLVIITELADGSLEDVYTRHRERGSSGIPRKAMLSYLQDSADALDYLNESFQLQHLDVKPGNLLMVGGHVKVADFGLLKDLRDVDCSVVGGLTPIYAPPEVFDGRPCATSDQYSLAVMYQELLTGTRPFTGRTIAQLATQHVHSAPNLESLPAGDRPVVARALEKAPERRFASCLEFVDALRAAGDLGIRNRNAGFANTHCGETQTGTFLGSSPVLGSMVEELPELTTDVKGLLPHGATEHALIIGIGGSGAECLHRLRGRIASMHPLQPIDMHSVLIDTDAETIEGARLAEMSGRVTPCTTIFTPLRTPQQYREAGTGHLASISRRWLYNVPRSGMTEGLRPLGRLAMVDHGALIKRQLSEAIDHLAAVCGNSVPRVYVVASLSGGTGSGMIWDVVYLVRQLMDSQGLAEVNVRPMVLIPNITGVSRQPLGTADAHAAIAELLHYLDPGNSYPGDSGADWPSVPSARSPLPGTYVLAGPDTHVQKSSVVEMLSEYIWADATKGGGVLQAARCDVDAKPDGISRGRPVVRSLGAARLLSCRKIELPRLARSLAVSMFKTWLGRPVEAKQLAANMAEKVARCIGIDSNGMQQAVWEPFSMEEPQLWKRLFDLFSKSQIRSFANDNLEELLQESGFELSETDEVSREYAANTLAKLRHEISVRLQDGRCDLTTACESMQFLVENMASAFQLHQLAGPRRLSESADAAAAMKRSLHFSNPSEIIGTAHEPGPVLRWAELRLRAAADSRLARRAELIGEGVRKLTNDLQSRITCVALAVKAINESTDSGDDPWKILSPELRSERGRAEDAARQACAPIVNTFTEPDFQDAVTGQALGNSVVDATLPILETLISFGDDSGAGVGYSSTEFESTADALQAIRPMLLVCGGRQRIVLLVGTEKERQMLADEVAQGHGHAVSVVVIPGVAPTLIHEAQGIPVSDIIGRLQSSLGGGSRVLRRLHARSDIRWNTCD